MDSTKATINTSGLKKIHNDNKMATKPNKQNKLQ